MYRLGACVDWIIRASDKIYLAEDDLWLNWFSLGLSGLVAVKKH
jgi:hypothetical protein